jgi:hypothetical protein
MNPDQYTNDNELIELRLQLHHEKCRADNLWEVVKFERAERKRLEAEIERLKQPAIIGGYNISQYIRMANSETLEFDNGDIFADMTLPERIKYIVESHARLKAEVENFNEYLKWHADGHKFAAWQVWRSQKSDGGQDKEVKS